MDAPIERILEELRGQRDHLAGRIDELNAETSDVKTGGPVSKPR